MSFALATNFSLPKPTTTTFCSRSSTLSLSFPSSSFMHQQPLQPGLYAKFSKLRPTFRLREVPEIPQVPTLPEVLREEAQNLRALSETDRFNQYSVLQQYAESQDQVFFNHKDKILVSESPFKLYIELEYQKQDDRVVLKFGGCASSAVNSLLGFLKEALGKINGAEFLRNPEIPWQLTESLPDFEDLYYHNAEAKEMEKAAILAAKNYISEQVKMVKEGDAEEQKETGEQKKKKKKKEGKKSKKKAKCTRVHKHTREAA